MSLQDEQTFVELTAVELGRFWAIFEEKQALRLEEGYAINAAFITANIPGPDRTTAPYDASSTEPEKPYSIELWAFEQALHDAYVAIITTRNLAYSAKQRRAAFTPPHTGAIDNLEQIVGTDTVI